MKYTIIVLMLLCFGCQSKIKNNAKVISPNGKYVAISATKSGGGAAGYVADLVYLIKKGNEYSSKDIVFKSLDTKGLKLKWIKDNILLISYKDADIIDFTNKKIYEKDNFRFKVEIVLHRKGINSVNKTKSK